MKWERAKGKGEYRLVDDGPYALAIVRRREFHWRWMNGDTGEWSGPFVTDKEAMRAAVAQVVVRE